MLYTTDNNQEEDADDFVVREDPASDGKSVWQLQVYRSAHELGVASHRLSLCLPKHELYETGSQLRRAAKSVSANLVEGYGRRRYKAEYLRFLTFAKASLDETEEHLRYVQDCHPEQQATAGLLLASADTLGRRLYRFMQLVEAHHRP